MLFAVITAHKIAGLLFPGQLMASNVGYINVANPDKNFVMIMKGGEIYKNSVK